MKDLIWLVFVVAIIAIASAAVSLSLLAVVGAWPWLEYWRELLP